MSTLRKIAAATLLVALSTTACTSGASDNDKDYEAQSRCEDYIKTLLKAPSTADFSGDNVADNGDGTRTVTGDVDSENGFGAKIRSSWTCVARDAGNDSWSVDSGSVDE